MHQKHFNNIIAKFGKELCNECSHYNKKYNICTLFNKNNKVTDFINHNPTYNKNNKGEHPLYCKQFVAGYTVPTPEDNKYFPFSNQTGC
jgi:hypothetical protein